MYSPLMFKLLCVLNIYGIVSDGNLDCIKCDEAGIMCIYPSMGPACVDFKSHGFTEEEQKLATQRMNEQRSRVALGKEIEGAPGPQPSAADMMELTWNDYLASTAQRYADQCTIEASDNDCRILTELYQIGENLNSYTNPGDSINYLTSIDRWYNQVKNFPSTLVDNMTISDDGIMTGNYAQAIYGKSYHVGCGKTRWENRLLVVCHYGPAISYFEPLYTRGPAASMCEEGTKSSYEGLCASGSSKIHLNYILLAFAYFLTSFLYT